MQQTTSSEGIFEYHFATFNHILCPYYSIKDECYVNAFNMHVAPNTTVLLHRNAVNDVLPNHLQIACSADYIVGRIIEFKDDNKIVVNLYEYFLDHDIHNTYGILPMTSNAGACFHVVEVVQTLRRAVLSDNAIYDVSFIFTVDEINSGMSCQLISNCFVVRFRYDYLCNRDRPFDSSYCFVPSPVVKNHRFAPSLICKNYSLTMTCFISNLWSNLTILQSVFFTALNRPDEKQGNYCTFSSEVNIDVYLWKYIYNKVFFCVKPFVLPVCKKKTIIMSNLTRHSVPIKGEEIILRFETKHQLEVLSSVVGVCCYAGVRRKRPRIRKKQKVSFNDTLNAVVGEIAIEEKLNPYTVRQGVDLIFYSDVNKCIKFFVKVRYYNVPYNNSMTYNELWPNQYIHAAMANDNAMDNHNFIKVGNMVQIEETVFRIIGVTPNEATLQAINDINEIRVFLEDEFPHLETLLMNYNLL